MKCGPATRVAGARVDLAELRQKQGDVDGAQGLLSEFFASWPRADETLPLFKRAGALRSELESSAPSGVK